MDELMQWLKRGSFKCLYFELPEYVNNEHNTFEKV